MTGNKTTMKTFEMPLGYDGVVFGTSEDSFKITPYLYKGINANSKSYFQNDLGSIFHIVLVSLKDGSWNIEENFEAILSDPMIYAKTFKNSGVFGVLTRKTEYSRDFLNPFIKEIFKIDFGE